jgi:hypothetical protein
VSSEELASGRVTAHSWLDPEQEGNSIANTVHLSFTRIKNCWRLRVALAALALAASGCGIDAAEPLPLDITIAADKLTTAPADSITFEIRAQGGNLLGISVEWGDGTSYVLPTGGARTAQSRVRHAYEDSGVYQVSAAADDATGSRKSVALNITIE